VGDCDTIGSLIEVLWKALTQLEETRLRRLLSFLLRQGGPLRHKEKKRVGEGVKNQRRTLNWEPSAGMLGW